MTNSRNHSRNKRPARLPTVLLSLALSAGCASVGQAEDITTLVITAKRPAVIDFTASIQDEMRAGTQIAVWQTQISVSTDLGVKLNQPSRAYRLAANGGTSKRG